MNDIIELLNRWGTDFLNFAWPMLWQSSLLIAVVFAFDFVLARRVRSAVRYALWMIVLVKLLLPPALALPTGAAWWLWRSHPAPTVPVIKNYTVTYDNTAPEYIPPPSVPYVAPPSTLSGEAWAVAAAGAMGVGLLLWLVFRWSRVAGKVRRAETSDAFASALDEARRLTRLRGRPRLKLVEDAQSPAVYGLFRPVILLPRALAEKLSARQLRAVLLHEVIHLRRGDVWVNCAQTLLQIAYWWHPLLWLANARIRRVREEAVDDAVMLALHDNGDGADAYAPTLLEVAKFVFRRPLASLGLLGLIGILESRSALRQRVERLIDFRPPRRAGITFLSLCGIFAFSAVALPMGQGPTEATDSLPTKSTSNTSSQKTKPLFFGQLSTPFLHREVVFIHGQFFWMTAADLQKIAANATYHPRRVDYAAAWTTDAEEFTNVEKKIKRLGLKPFNAASVITANAADFYCGNQTNWIDLECDPYYVGDKGIKLNLTATSASVLWQDELAKTNLYKVNGSETVDNNGAIVVSMQDANNPQTNLVVVLNVKTMEEPHAAGNNPQPQNASKTIDVSYDAAPPNTSDSDNKQKAGELEHEGHQFYDQGRFADAEEDFSNALVLGPVNVAATRYWLFEATKHDQLTSVHLDQFGPYDQAPLRDVVEDLNQKATNVGAIFNIHFYVAGNIPAATNTFVTLKRMNDVSLSAAFDSIVQGASQPTIYSVEDVGGVEFSTGPERDFRMRTFKVDPNNFYTGITNINPLSDPDAKVKVNGRGLLYVTTPNLARDVGALVAQYFSSQGVDLNPPKSIFYNERLGVIFVYAPEKDLKTIEHIIQKLNSSPAPKNVSKDLSISTASNKLLDDPMTASYVVDPPQATDTNGLEMETFQVNRNALCSDLEKSLNLPPLQTAFRSGGGWMYANTPDLSKKVNEHLNQYFSQLGINLNPPKSVFYNDRYAVIYVHATEKDLETIRHIIEKINYVSPMIHIKARFMEVPSSFFSSAIMHDYFPAGVTNGMVMTNPNFQVLLHELQLQKGLEELAEPEVTTITGRHTQMHATDSQEVVTNYTAVQNPDGGHPGVLCIYPQTTSVEVGPILDVVPYVLADGYTINLTTIPSLVQFFGYASPQGLPVTYATNAVTGDRTTVPISLPAFQVSEAHAQKNVWDGQTFILFPDKLPQQSSVYATDEKRKELITEHIREAEKSYGDKTLVVLVTATLIDPAGNRVHTDDEMPFAQRGVPVQVP